jgi:hypothetical protein
MALGLTQPLTEMSTRNLPGVKGRLVGKADVTAICELIVEPRHLTRFLGLTVSGGNLTLN